MTIGGNGKEHDEDIKKIKVNFFFVKLPFPIQLDAQ